MIGAMMELIPVTKEQRNAKGSGMGSFLLVNILPD